MTSLAHTILFGLQTQREMAIASGNKMRLEYLDREIEKLKSQIEMADKNGHGLVIK